MWPLENATTSLSQGSLACKRRMSNKEKKVITSFTQVPTIHRELLQVLHSRKQDSDDLHLTEGETEAQRGEEAHGHTLVSQQGAAKT